MEQEQTIREITEKDKIIGKTLAEVEIGMSDVLFSFVDNGILKIEDTSLLKDSVKHRLEILWNEIGNNSLSFEDVIIMSKDGRLN